MKEQQDSKCSESSQNFRFLPDQLPWERFVVEVEQFYTPQ